MTSVDYSARLIEDLEKLQVHEFTPVNIFSICVTLMQSIEQYPELTGPQKKEFVTKAMTTFAARLGAPELLLEVLSAFIDIAMSLNNKELVIERLKSLKCCC